LAPRNGRFLFFALVFIKKSSTTCHGFSLLELLLVMSIIGILASLLFRSADRVQARAEAAHCIANLHSLHHALSAYIQDYGQWPQEPEDINGRVFEKWWINALLPYTDNADVWMCPTMKRRQSGLAVDERALISYTPSLFDEHEFTPMRWNQPWLTEIGDYHGTGNLILVPDGSIRPAREFAIP